MQEAGRPVENLAPERWLAAVHRQTHAPLSHMRAAKRYQRRRKLKNFSRNRPDTTNLNHQCHPLRRHLLVLALGSPQLRISITPNPATECDTAHIVRIVPALRAAQKPARDAPARPLSFVLRDWCPLADHVRGHAFAQYALACDDRHLQ